MTATLIGISMVTLALVIGGLDAIWRGRGPLGLFRLGLAGFMISVGLQLAWWRDRAEFFAPAPGTPGRGDGKFVPGEAGYAGIPFQHIQAPMWAGMLLIGIAGLWFVVARVMRDSASYLDPELDTESGVVGVEELLPAGHPDRED